MINNGIVKVSKKLLVIYFYLSVVVGFFFKQTKNYVPLRDCSGEIWYVYAYKSKKLLNSSLPRGMHVLM